MKFCENWPHDSQVNGTTIKEAERNFKKLKNVKNEQFSNVENLSKNSNGGLWEEHR